MLESKYNKRFNKATFMNLRKVSNELLKYFGRSADNALLPKMLRIASEASYAVIVSSGDDDDDDGVLRFIGENEVKIPLLRKKP